MRRKFIALATTAVAVVAMVLLSTGGGSPVRADPGPGPSVNVAIIDGPGVIMGGTLPTGAPDFTPFNFYNVPVASVSLAALTTTACGGGPCDTVVLNVASSGMNCTTGSLSASQKTDLNAFVAAGNKMIIYDSECQAGVGVNYSWLTYPFTTSNPGAMGASGPAYPLTIVEDNTLSHNSSVDPYYINTTNIENQTDAVGDMNTMVTLDPAWCIDMSGKNFNGVTGPVHTYARSGTVGSVGLFIYNGLDVDQIVGSVGPSGGGQLAKIWLHELEQPFNPDNLPCEVPVVGIKLEPDTDTNDVGTDHTVTATVTDLLGQPVQGVDVSFEVLTGPNAGDTGMDTTDVNGEATFTYTGDGGSGVDTIEACFTPAGAQEICSNIVEKEWTPPLIPTPTPRAVGSAVEMRVDGSDSPASLADGSGAAGPPYAAMAGAAAAAIAIAAGAWYARRRWLR